MAPGMLLAPIPFLHRHGPAMPPVTVSPVPITLSPVIWGTPLLRHGGFSAPQPSVTPGWWHQVGGHTLAPIPVPLWTLCQPLAQTQCRWVTSVVQRGWCLIPKSKEAASICLVTSPTMSLQHSQGPQGDMDGVPKPMPQPQWGGHSTHESTLVLPRPSRTGKPSPPALLLPQDLSPAGDPQAAGGGHQNTARGGGLQPQADWQQDGGAEPAAGRQRKPGAEPLAAL